MGFGRIPGRFFARGSAMPQGDLKAALPESLPWYRTITRQQWHVLIAAQLGWMLDAMDFVLYLMAITTLEREFGFGPETAGLLASATLISSSVGGFLFGAAADLLGRTRALMITILIYSLCSLGAATSQDVAQLLLWRAALGLGMGGEWSAGAVLVSESWPAQHRGKAIGIMQSGWAIGYMLAALISALVLPRLGWRWLFAFGALPALLVFWIRRHVPEPEIWTRGGRREANPLRLIFGRDLVGRTVSASLLAASVMFGYWGLFTWLPAFLASPVERGGAGMSIVKSAAWIVPVQAGAFLGYLSFGFISDRVGRRFAFIAYLVAAAALAPIYGHMGRNPLALILLGPALGFVGHGYFSLFGALLSELFPTAARATAQGFTYNIGRGLSALAPYTIGALAEVKGIGPALALTSIFFLIGAALMLLIPETRGKELDS